jgi:hypothetical protein
LAIRRRRLLAQRRDRLSEQLLVAEEDAPAGVAERDVARAIEVAPEDNALRGRVLRPSHPDATKKASRPERHPAPRRSLAGTCGKVG